MEIAMAAARELQRFPSKEVILGGYSFKLHGIGADDAYFAAISPNLDTEFYALCRRLIPPDYVCLDVGANIGIKSLFLARHCPAGRVIAIEPAPTVARCLEANIAENAATQVVMEQTAVGDTRGSVRLKDASAWGHISQDGVEVPITTLEEIVGRLGLPRVDFIKIDTEGSEFLIMRSSLDLINRFESLVLVELNSWTQLAIGNTNPRDFIDWILGNFSHVFILRRRFPEGDLLEPLTQKDGLVLLHRNLVHDGCVTDLLVTNADWRLTPTSACLQGEFQASTAQPAGRETAIAHDTDRAECDTAIAERETARVERDAALAERDAAKAACDTLRESKSWRLTAPLRWIRARLPIPR
jgi:FkbM family methyltransferase